MKRYVNPHVIFDDYSKPTRQRRLKLETLWGAVQRWATDNGKIYDEGYGVVGVAAT